MPIRTLFEGRVSEYLAEERDRPGILWLFLRIPKTAGTSLEYEVGPVLQPAARIAVDYLDFDRPFLEQMDAAVERFIQTNREVGCRLATGHFRMNHAERIRSTYRSVKLFTMLRDPVERVLSDYYYQRTPRHPPYERFRAQFPTLESFVESRSAQNGMHDHLALPSDGSVQAVIDRVESTFSFVGTQETYPASFRLLFRLLGRDRAPSLHENKTVRRQASDAESDARLRARIRALNALDVEVYDHFRHRLEAGHACLLQHLES